jgi:putative N6-adenine-specific DNA methylase
MTENNQMRFIAKTFSGFEQILSEELKELGAHTISPLRRAVEFHGSQETLYKANYLSRLSLMILKPVASFPAADPQSLYDGVRKIEWMKLFDLGKTFSIRATSVNSKMDHTHFISQKTKDAIADYFRSKFGQRPDVDKRDADVQVFVHINNDQCEISLNSSGDPLFKRGYRRHLGPAPLSEVLAAGLIRLSGWDAKSTFVDPMCGSGTLAIEAAMLSMNLPAAYYREKFSFFHWSDFDPTIWRVILEEEEKKIKEFDHYIYASDISPKSIEIAHENAQMAKLHKDISFKQVDIANINFPEGGGTIIINPPYGERIQSKDIVELYTSIGDRLKFHAPGYNAWVISSDVEALKRIGMKPKRRLHLYNGPLECRYHGFSIFEGSRKEFVEGQKK